MKKSIRLGVVLLALVMLSACNSVSVTDYQDNRPVLSVEGFFSGNLTAHGIVKDRSGLVIRTFEAQITPEWKNGIGVLNEQFLFDDGERQTRIWTLFPNPTGGYIGKANDVVGEAQLQVSGNSLFLEYVLSVPYKDGTIDLKIDDRMYLVSDDILINESIMTKWGVEVGQLTLVIVKNS